MVYKKKPQTQQQIKGGEEMDGRTRHKTARKGVFWKMKKKENEKKN